VPHLIQHFAALDPRLARLRRRADRRLKGQRPSKAAEMWYRAMLFAIVAQLALAGRAIAAELRPSWPAGGARDEALAIAARDAIVRGDVGAGLALDRPRTLARLEPTLQTVLARAAAKFGGISRVAADLAAGAVDRNLSAVDKQLASSARRSIGVDVTPFLRPGRRIQAAIEQASIDNVALITSMPGKYLARVHDVVVKNWTEGERWESMVAGIAEAGQIAKRRANVIARDQTSKMNSAFNEARQRSIGIRRYVWRDCGIYSGPHRVRPSHQQMNGQVCEWAHPPEVDGEHVHPGEAVLCRCIGEPVVNLDVFEMDDDVGMAA
jgi:SPP1 gp7 family putative phage head morphogenesis protein